MMKTPSLLPSHLPSIVSPLFLATLVALGACAHAHAQAPAGSSTEEQLYQQRRTELRSALSVNARPGDATPKAGPGPRQLSTDERRELRQQLRQQYRQPPKTKP